DTDDPLRWGNRPSIPDHRLTHEISDSPGRGADAAVDIVTIDLAWLDCAPVINHVSASLTPPSILLVGFDSVSRHRSWRQFVQPSTYQCRASGVAAIDECIDSGSPGRAGVVEPTHFLQGEAEVVQRHAFTVPVVGLPVDLDSLGEGGDRLIEPTNFLQGEAEDVQRHAFTVPVVGLPV